MPSRANKAADLSALTAANPVFDTDNVYLSDRGWAYRHYKNEAKTEYWDEILVAGEVAASDNPDIWCRRYSSANPTFETGNSVQAPALTIAPATLLSFDAATVSTTTDVVVIIDSAVGDETYTWSTDETGATFSDATAAPTLTHAATPGTFTLTCEIASATATDSPVTVTFDYEVVAA